MRFLRRSLIGVFLLSVTLGLLALAGNTVRGAVQERMNAEPRSFPQRERVFAVNVLTIEPQTLNPLMRVFGEVRSTRTLDLRSAAGGTVLEVSPAMIEGGEIQTGELLLAIDPATAQAARDRSSADLQDAQAELRDAERAVSLAEAELTAASAQADLRKQALTRAQDLAERGVGSAAAVENAELAVSAADATVLSRRQGVASAVARIDQATTRLARSQIDLQEANRALDDTQIWAMFDGLLSDVTISPGGRVSPNERFATLVDPDRLEVSFRVSTTQYARLLDQDGTLPELPIEISLDVSGVDLVATGQISRESAAVGAGQTGRLIFARLDAAPGFRPGDFVTVTVEEPPLERVAMVPSSAVAADQTVLVVGEENRLASAQVELLRRQGDAVIIRARGLAGQQIVAERSPLLGAGIGVRPITADEAEAGPTAPEMLTLDADRKAKLLAFVDGSRMPDTAKARIVAQLEQDEVPADVVSRLESRMGS